MPSLRSLAGAVLLIITGACSGGSDATTTSSTFPRHVDDHDPERYDDDHAGDDHHSTRARPDTDDPGPLVAIAAGPSGLVAVGGSGV